jgi:outer membrane protein TolC
MSIRTLFLGVWLVAGLTFPQLSSAQLLLSENNLIRLAREATPVSQQIDATQDTAKAQQFAVKSEYDPKLEASYTYAASRENAIIQFVPVFNPQKLFNLGVSQRTSLGTTFNTQVFSQQISTDDGFVNNATQVGVIFGVEIDIWKNALGRLDRSQLRAANINKQVADLKADIDKHSFILDVRKTYWSLIANEMSLDLSKELVKTASQQLRESQRKLREGLGDSGDIARNQAQLQSRQSSVLFFDYQKEILIARMKSLLPGLDQKTLMINTREALDMENRARQCMNQIMSSPQLKTEFSRFDDIVALLDKQKENEIRVAEATDSFDVKLQAQYQASGVENSHGEAFDRLADDFRNGYQVGVAVQIPLGGELTRSREAQVGATRNRFDAQRSQMALQLKAEHQKIQRAMTLLLQASQSQGATVESLKKSLKRTKRKFKQARVSLNTFILEQDNLFSSELQLIDTKRQVLHLLLDYFKIFTNHPCEINQMQGVQS